MLNVNVNVPGIGNKLVSNWEQNMLHKNFSKFYIEKGYLC